MTERIVLKLWNPVQATQAVRDAWPNVKALLMAGHRLVLEIRQETRSSEQNRRLWALLTELSEQVDWYGNKLSPEEWKDVLTASLKKQKAVPGIDGGFVVLGQRTSKMTVSEMSELQTLIEAFGAEHNVKFKEEREEESKSKNASAEVGRRIERGG